MCFCPITLKLGTWAVGFVNLNQGCQFELISEAKKTFVLQKSYHLTQKYWFKLATLIKIKIFFFLHLVRCSLNRVASLKKNIRAKYAFLLLQFGFKRIQTGNPVFKSRHPSCPYYFYLTRNCCKYRIPCMKPNAKFFCQWERL